MTKKKIARRFEKLPNHPGIRKDLRTSKYVATKWTGDKSYSKTHSNLKDAIVWRTNFNSDEESDNGVPVEIDDIYTSNKKVRKNGNDFEKSFNDVWTLYQKLYFPTLEKSTIDLKIDKGKRFYNLLLDVPIYRVDHLFIDEYLLAKVELAKKMRHAQRCNFFTELKYLKAMLNWYIRNYDPTFINPVLPRHKTMSIIKKTVHKEKKMSREELILFFDKLPEFWRGFAECQFYMAARVQEVAGLQVQSLNFEDRSIMVKDVVVWGRDKKFDYLKPAPKNSEIRFCFMGDRIFDILKERVGEVSRNKGFVFTIEGKPVAYRQVQYHYNMALKKAGLSDRFSSTHMLRHSMATITRRVTGGLDGAQAVTGHKDSRILQMYASLPDDANVSAVKSVEEFMFRSVQVLDEN